LQGRRLGLTGNQLSGGIPPEIENLTNLQYLNLYGNQLSGSIPAGIGNLTNLQDLDLGDNHLSGSIPVEIESLTNLQDIDLSGNQLSGSIPVEIESLTTLQGLDLSGNQLSGSIPPSLTNLTNIKSFATDLGYNALYTDDIPLSSFLSSKDPDWQKTQTIAPENVAASPISETTIEVSWTPIIFTSNSGGYSVYYSTTPDGPYTLFNTTQDKLDSNLKVTGLNSKTTYYFVVQSRTDSHVNNQNTVYSDYSGEVSASTTGTGGGGGCFIGTAASIFRW